MSTTPPPVIHSAKLLAFATVDDSVTFTNRMVLFVGGIRLGQVPKIALCQNYCASNEVLIFFCDEEWEPLGTAVDPTVAEAKDRIERTYEGINKLWMDSPYSENEVRDYLINQCGVDPDSEWWAHKCSFCGKDDSDFRPMMETDKASICGNCIDAFYAIIHEQK